MDRSGLRGPLLAVCALVILTMPIALVGGCGHEIDSPTPTGNGVSPDLVCNAEPADATLTSIVVTGDHFTPMPSKTLEGKRELLLPQISLIGGTALPVNGAMAPPNFTFPDDPASPATSRLHWDSEKQMHADIQPTDMIPPGVFSIRVTNPDKKSAVTLSNVLAVLPPPSISALIPPAICDAESDQTITVNGAYFLSYDGATPTVTVGDKTYTATPDPKSCMPVVGNFKEMNVELCTTLTFTIPKGDFTVTTAMKFPVKVTNPAPANCASSETVTLTIEPPPLVQTVKPANVCEGGSELTIQGSGFIMGATVTLDCMGTMIIASSTSVTPDGMTVTAKFGPGAMVGQTCQVIVTNPDGCFDTPPHKDVGVLSGPILFFVTPDVVYNGINTRITLYSTTITPPLPADAVTMVLTGQSSPVIQLMFQTVTGHPNRLEAIVPSGTAPGVYDVTLKDGSPCPATLPKAITVTGNLTVSLASIDPAFGSTTEDTAVTIFRNAAAAAPMNDPFKPTPRVFLNPTAGAPTDVAVEMTSVSFIDQNKVNGVVPQGTPVHKYDVVLVNPDGGVGLLPGGYTEINGQPPVIDTATPSSIVAATGQQVTLTGRGFAATDVVSIRCEDAMGNPVAAPTVTSQAPTCATGCTQNITINGSGLASGDVCVVRITNPDGSYGDYSAIGVTNASLNLSAPVAGPDMNVGRRALAGASGNATNTARFVYAIGGDSGAPTGALSSVEFAPVDLFGKIGAWSLDPISLPGKRTLAGETTVGRYIYLIGGNDSTGPVTAASRALILSPTESPVIEDLDLALDTAGLGMGEWHYKVSAVFSAADPDNPGGESLPSDEFSMKLPMIGQKLVKVTLIWKAPVDSLGQPLPNVVGYNIYRTAMAGGAPGTEVLLGTSATTTFTDDGSKTPGTAVPLPQGSTGEWATLPALGTAREALGVTAASDPVTAGKFYVYALLGRTGASDTGSYEYLPVTTAPNGRQTVGAAWTPGLQASPTPRDEVGIWTATNQTSNTIPANQTFIYVGGGKDTTGTLTGKVEAGLVAAGGDLGVWNDLPKDFSSNQSGYAVCAANDQLFLFGGAGGGPSKQAKSATLIAPPPSLANNSWNNEGLSMTHGRYLMGNAVQSAFIFLLGGQTDEPSPASKTTEHVIW